MSTQDFIETVCKKCDYYKKGCFFDYGDSLTKIPCQALIQLRALLENLELNELQLSTLAELQEALKPYFKLVRLLKTLKETTK
jgi:hypothetical protein